MTESCRVAIAEWLARWTPNHKIVGSSPAKSQSAHQNRPVWATGGDNGASVHSAVKWVPGYRQRWQLYLGYPWRLEACEQVYTPQGVEPGKALYKNCILLLLWVFTSSWRKEASVLAAVHRFVYSSSNMLTNCLAWDGVLLPDDSCLSSRTFISITYSLPCDSRRWKSWCGSRVHNLCMRPGQTKHKFLRNKQIQ